MFNFQVKRNKAVAIKQMTTASLDIGVWAGGSFLPFENNDKM